MPEYIQALRGMIREQGQATVLKLLDKGEIRDAGHVLISLSSIDSVIEKHWATPENAASEPV